MLRTLARPLAPAKAPALHGKQTGFLPWTSWQQKKRTVLGVVAAQVIKLFKLGMAVAQVQLSTPHVDVVTGKLELTGLAAIVGHGVVGMLTTVRELMGTVGGEINACDRR